MNGERNNKILFHYFKEKDIKIKNISFQENTLMNGNRYILFSFNCKLQFSIIIKKKIKKKFKSI